MEKALWLTARKAILGVLSELRKSRRENRPLHWETVERSVWMLTDAIRDTYVRQDVTNATHGD